MSVSASLPRRFFWSARLPVFECSSPSRRWANASCSASVNGWSWKTSTPYSSMPARIGASVSAVVDWRRSIGLTSATKSGWSLRNVRAMAGLPPRI